MNSLEYDSTVIEENFQNYSSKNNPLKMEEGKVF